MALFPDHVINDPNMSKSTKASWYSRGNIRRLQLVHLDLLQVVNMDEAGNHLYGLSKNSNDPLIDFSNYFYDLNTNDDNGQVQEDSNDDPPINSIEEPEPTE